MRIFKQDRRILVFNHPDEIPDWTTLNNEYGANGILCPYNPFSSEERRMLIQFMQERMRARTMIARDTDHDIPAPLKRAFGELKKLFTRCSGDKAEAALHANNTFPEEHHAHTDEIGLTYTFTGIGTLGLNRRGKEYAVPVNNIFMFDESIEHRASQVLPPRYPKLTITVG